jgi:glycosyltransferase involved in cell wall biosynthesis
MLLSIVIPAREEEKAIAATIAQFKNSLTIPHEIIVSDARSKDRTVAIARETAYVVVVFDGTKHTAGIGRNDGAKIATGDFVAFVDADAEIWQPQAFFERALKHFDDPKVVGVACPQRALPRIETWADRFSFGYLNLMYRLQNNVLHMGAATGKCMLVRREAWAAVGGFREDLMTNEDNDFFNRLSRIGRTVYDPSLMVYHGARRAHKIGWTRLWYIWTMNIIWFWLFDKSAADDWTPIR